MQSDCVRVEDFNFPHGWDSPIPAGERSRVYCEELERGGILFFRNPPFDLPREDHEFLIAQRDAQALLHKNVSYRPNQDRLKGFAGEDSARDRLHRIMKGYSSKVTAFFNRFLIPYAGKWRRDYASFRPIEESGRKLPLRKRNDLLHVDAFPTRPTRGDRILRVFTNLNPDSPRVWQTTLEFEALARQYAFDCGLRHFANGNSAFNASAWKRVAHIAARITGIQQLGRSDYDRFMLRFHDYLKENAEFQSASPKTTLEFPPLATWLVFTDGVAHSVLAGRYALEQTFLIPTTALVAPEKSPYRILENLAGAPLIQ